AAVAARDAARTRMATLFIRRPWCQRSAPGRSTGADRFSKWRVLRGLEGTRPERPALRHRTGQHALSTALAVDRVRLGHAREQVLGEVAAVPDHAVPTAIQVALDVVEHDLDRIRIGHLVVEDAHTAMDLIAGQAHPAAVHSFQIDTAADGA